MSEENTTECVDCEDCSDGCCDGCTCDCCGSPENKVGIIDRMLEKAISRKLIVFLTATGLLAWSDLDPDTWGLIAICYIGGQSVIDAVKTYKHGL